MATTKQKQANGTDKVKVTRNEFTNLAKEFVNAASAAELGTATQLQIVLKAAEKTNNKDSEREKFRDALKASYADVGVPVNTAKVYVSEAIRICEAYFLTMPVMIDGSDKAVRMSGKELFQGKGYGFAKSTSSKMKRFNGIKSKNDGSANKAPRKAKAIDVLATLDLVIASIKQDKAYDRTIVNNLVAVKLQIATVAKQVKVKTADKANVARVVDVATMSRGQKAAATRRANELKAQHIPVPANGRTKPVATVMH